MYVHTHTVCAGEFQKQGSSVEESGGDNSKIEDTIARYANESSGESLCMYVLYVCTVCMYVCTVYMYVFMYVCTVCMYVLYVCMYVCIYCIYVCMYALLCIYVRMYVSMYIT